MIKGLTKSQEAALDEMSPSEWYSVYELDASRKTLEGLYDMGCYISMVVIMILIYCLEK